ncbi:MULTISPECIES: MarR family winged helix-turn-helix transcriptional regulator [unclassified Streptomyces]|uniref:MarR family winged helix-turn-helix transcriptional regulator n=1 Tax=unclassified Streptomyces TaxID=2593676 RepID=UPI00278C86EE|nr:MULTISPECIES: MarR family transcriptional regulator [unclassified Streptomyces]
MSDHVDHVMEQWALQGVGLDVSPMAVVGRIKRLAQIIESELRVTYNQHAIDAAAFDVLATLRRSPPPHQLTPAELMRAAMVTSGAITQRLDRLEGRGLISRDRRHGDGRSIRVSLTPEGRELIEGALKDNFATQERILAGLTPAQRERLGKDLRRLLQTLGDA